LVCSKMYFIKAFNFSGNIQMLGLLSDQLLSINHTDARDTEE